MIEILPVDRSARVGAAIFGKSSAAFPKFKSYVFAPGCDIGRARAPAGKRAGQIRVPAAGDIVMLAVGIVGCNYGRNVLLPAFRSDPRCEVVALAGTDAGRTAELARAANVARAFGDWHALVENGAVAAVAIAVPPDLQPAVARRALDLGKPVFVEKPLAADLAGGRAMLESAQRSGQPTIIDFNFPELPAWRSAKALLDSGRLGRLRHVAVSWNTENQAVRLRLKSWKTAPDGGGGVLGNFVSHCLHYLEWFCGPISGMGGRLFRLPDGEAQTGVALALAFASGVGGSLQMSCASFLGSGHRVEFYGDDGTLVLANPTTDYFRNFTLRHGSRGDDRLQSVPVADASGDASSDSRIAPVSRLVGRFLDACENGTAASPAFAEGYRVQQLMDAAQRAHGSGRWIDMAVPAGGQPT
jgi:predicted dehydrogenase